MTRNKKDNTIVILLVIIVFGAMIALPLAKYAGLFMWPGTEGLDAGTAGYQVKEGSAVGYYATNESFPTNSDPKYEWTQWPTVDVYNTLLKKSKSMMAWWPENTLRIERQSPTRDESVAGKQIEYWINDTDPQGNPRSTKFVGTVVPWTFIIQLSIVPGTDDDGCVFQNGEAIWFGLGTRKWNRAYGPETGYKDYSGWSIPLSVYVENWDPRGNWENNDRSGTKAPSNEMVADCVQITPDYAGRTVTLFSNPETPVSLDSAWYQGNLNDQGLNDALKQLNGTLYPNPNPDSEFSNHAYFKFTFTRFKPFEEDIGPAHVATWFPSVYYKLRVYYLELGNFTYVQEEFPPWDPRGWSKTLTPFAEFWNSIGGAIGWFNPFNIFGDYAGLVAFIFTLMVAGFVILILLAIFAPWTIPRIFEGLRSAAKGTRGIYKDLKGRKGK